jgi:hypothetical protein
MLLALAYLPVKDKTWISIRWITDIFSWIFFEKEDKNKYFFSENQNIRIRISVRPKKELLDLGKQKSS